MSLCLAYFSNLGMTLPIGEWRVTSGDQNIQFQDALLSGGLRVGYLFDFW
jgi:hypothetical protein